MTIIVREHNVKSVFKNWQNHSKFGGPFGEGSRSFLGGSRENGMIFPFILHNQSTILNSQIHSNGSCWGK